MKKLLTFFLILSTTIILGCKSAPKEDFKIILPPKPQREKIELPQDLKDYVLIIAYYDNLVDQWELWGDTVELILTETER